MTDANTIYQRPVELLQHLLRFDTTNPPGNEEACIIYIDNLLRSVGIGTLLLENTPGRPNLIARLKGTGSAPPLMIYGHVDVVPTDGQDWTHPPFGGDLIDGYVWGRGTLDMKGGVAMMLSAFMRAHIEGTTLPGDVVLCVVSDEEAGGNAGARFLAAEHADLFAGIRYALGEFGGFSFYVDGKRFYPIQVTEKGICWMKATVRGPAGHGSLPMPGGTMARLADALGKLSSQRLPVHITPPVQQMFETLAAHVSAPMSDALTKLIDPQHTDAVLDELGMSGRMFNALLHNTASPNVIYGSSKINVIPGSASIEIDCRLLPGQTPDDAIREIGALIGTDIEIEVVRADIPPATIDMGLFDTLAGILHEADPDSMAVPLVMFGGTDGRFFAQIGIQTYGFLPMKMPEEFNFLGAIHAADERIPATAVEFGTEAVFQALQRFGA